jgi:hypothetical protein
MIITPRNWRDFQHYKDRAPPWIRLHRALLDNFDFHSLPVASRALAPMLWLLASEYVDGAIDATPAKLAFRLRMLEADVVAALKPLIDKGFFVPEQGDSKVLATSLQPAVPEAEREAETKTEGKAEAKKPRKRGGGAEAAALNVADLVAEGVDEQVAKDWLTLRKAKRLPLTKTAWQAVVEHAKAVGMTNAQAICTAVDNNWAGFKASWVHNLRLQRGGGSGHGGKPPSAHDLTGRDYTAGVDNEGGLEP